MNQSEPTDLPIQLGKAQGETAGISVFKQERSHEREDRVRVKVQKMGRKSQRRKGLAPCGQSKQHSRWRVSQGRGFPASARFSRDKCISPAEAHASNARYSNQQTSDSFLRYLIYVSQIISWEPEKAFCHESKK